MSEKLKSMGGREKKNQGVRGDAGGKGRTNSSDWNGRISTLQIKINVDPTTLARNETFHLQST